MPNRLEVYEASIARYLKSLPSELREGELREIGGHLRQLADDFEREGHDADAAQALAVSRFGSARAVGLRLRDVWEGNKSAWLVGAVTLVSNWMLEAYGYFHLLKTLLVVTLDHLALRDALMPLFAAWFLGLLFVVPFGWNFVLGRWGGRRVTLFAACAYVSPLVFPLVRGIGLSTYVGDVTVGVYGIAAQMMTLAVLGALAGSVLSRRKRFALIVGVAPEAASVELRRRRVNWRGLAVLASMTMTSVAAGYAFFKPRVDAVLHPPTPQAAVRVKLHDPGVNYDELAPATNVSVRLLPPATPAERAGKVRRVAYSATMHATPNYRQRRLDFYEKSLRSQGKGAFYKLKWVRAAKARLGPQGFRVHGIAKAHKVGRDWQAELDGKERAWLYDMFYAR